MGPRSLAIAAMLALIAVHDVPAALACSPPAPCVSRGAVEPGDGSIGLPTNFEIRLSYHVMDIAVEDGVFDLGLRVEGGDPVDVEVESRTTYEYFGSGRHFVVRATEPLEPQTTYELTDHLPEDSCFTGPVAATEEPQVVATFTTGDGPDAEPPQFEGVQSVEATVFECFGGMCCAGDALLLQLEWSEALDASALPLRYRVYDADTMTPLHTTSLGATGATAAACGSPGAHGNSFRVEGQGEHTFLVRAVDLAGNEDDNEVTVSYDVDCEEALSPDPEPEPGPEAQPEPGPEPQPESGPEPQAEPSPEGQPEHAPEPGPEPQPEPSPEPAPDASDVGTPELQPDAGLQPDGAAPPDGGGPNQDASGEGNDDDDGGCSGGPAPLGTSLLALALLVALRQRRVA
ncbi:MAG: hypothetical protein ACQEXJ_19340 [Myxococcota bacterium]